MVRPKAEKRYPIPVLLAVRFASIFRSGAREPLARIVGGENLAADQRAHPDGEVVGGGDGAAGRRGVGRILVRVVVGLQSSPLGRSDKIGGVRGIRQGVRGTSV